MARTIRSRGRQAEPQSLGLTFWREHVALWREIVLLVAAVVPLASGLIGLATGAIALTGDSFFSSPFFWTFYGLLLIVITTTVADVVVLSFLRKRLRTRDNKLPSHEAPDGYYLISYLFWLLLLVPYSLAVGAMALKAEPFLIVFVFMLTVGGGLTGGYAVGWMAFAVDKLANPWD